MRLKHYRHGFYLPLAPVERIIFTTSGEFSPLSPAPMRVLASATGKMAAK
jgi:hypothetical protein